MRSEARASDLLPNFPGYKTPTLSYETHPNDLKFGYLQAFRGHILTVDNSYHTRISLQTLLSAYRNKKIVLREPPKKQAKKYHIRSYI